MEESHRPPKSLPAYAVVGLTVLAPALGGSTELWAQASLAIATGLLFLVYPPNKSLGWVANSLLLALLAIACVGFLPASWFPLPQWRSQLSNLGAQLPSTRSPQPWLTLQWVCLLFFTLVWAYYLTTVEWRHRFRRRACVVYAIGILCLTVALIAGFLTKQRVPFWPETEQFGFFPNRNQTSNVLGLGGVMIYALGMQALQEGRRYWWLWPASLCVVCWALILNFSRSGIILFFLGALAVHFYWWRTAKERQRPILAIVGLAFLLAVFLINGGATLARFGHETTGMLSESGNLRWFIYKDAVQLLMQSPIFGVGLGNFRSIFAFNRVHSAFESDIAHPESDWLWSAVDLGVIAPLILFVLLFWWIKKCLPLDPGSVRLLRLAALVGVGAFLVHGFFDVSAHRIGALWPALFLSSIALHPGTQFKTSRAAAPWFRLFGLGLVLIGLWWISSTLGGTVLPTSAAEEKIRADITSAIEQENYVAVSALADSGLKIAPMDWLLYYKRGLAEVALGTPQPLALRDFAVARYLNPLWPDLYLREGEVWLAASETDLALDTWQQGLQHADDKNGSLFSRILSVVGDDPEKRDRLRQLVGDNRIYLLLFLRSASPFEFRIEIDRLLSDDALLRSFSPNELEAIFSIWYEKADKLELAENLRAHPDWLKIGWKQLARICADYQDYRQAYETVLKFDPPPALPAKNSDEPLEKLAARFQINQNDIQNGIALYQAQLKRDQKDAAIVTLQKLESTQGSPKYLFYLEAQLWAQAGQWQKAWEAVARYEPIGR